MKTLFNFLMLLISLIGFGCNVSVICDNPHSHNVIGSAAAALILAITAFRVVAELDRK